jgi:cell division protein FtsI (penicillin-binding protein 3)
MQQANNEFMAENMNTPYSKSGFKPELESTLAYLNIPYESSDSESKWVKTFSSEEGVKLRRSDVSNIFLPDVKDMGAKDAVYLLENMGFRVEINGRGTVRGQDPLPGEIIKKGARIKLEMSITEG